MKDEPRALAETVNWLREIRAMFDRSEHFRFGVFLKDGTLVGENMLLQRVGPDAFEIGYLTLLGFEGKGFASEASSAMVRLAFEHYGARRLEIHHAAMNEASAGIPRRLGFAHEATLREHFDDTEGTPHDAWIWCLHRVDYPGTPSAALEMDLFDAMDEEI